MQIADVCSNMINTMQRRDISVVYLEWVQSLEFAWRVSVGLIPRRSMQQLVFHS